MAMASATQAKSSLRIRSAAARNEEVMSRPTRISTTMRPNSSEVGEGASAATVENDCASPYPARMLPAISCRVPSS